MANPPRVKGTRAESAAAKWLTDTTGVTFKRNALSGNADKGDLRGDGLDWLVVEIKNTKTPSPKQWARELAAEQRNAGAAHGVILWSPPGVGMAHVDEWVAFCSYQFCTVIPVFGTLLQLPKFVAHIDATINRGVFIDGLCVTPAHRWLIHLQGIIASKAMSAAAT